MWAGVGGVWLHSKKGEKSLSEEMKGGDRRPESAQEVTPPSMLWGGGGTPILSFAIVFFSPGNDTDCRHSETLKTLTSLNKESRAFILGDNSI